MADPILPDHWRAQIIFQGSSNLPEDRFVNSFVFRNNGDISTNPVDQRIRDVLEDFYFAAAPGASFPIWDYMAQQNVATVQVKCYDLGAPPPRNPVEGQITGFPKGATGLPLPTEVAAVLSLRTNLRTPRGRGRIYLGPLTTAAVEESPAGTVRLKPQFRTDVTKAALRLMEGNGGFVGWTVLSQVDDTARPVIGGYVDDAFDTQRRRGIAPMTRTTFGTVL